MGNCNDKFIEPDDLEEHDPIEKRVRLLERIVLMEVRGLGSQSRREIDLYKLQHQVWKDRYA